MYNLSASPPLRLSASPPLRSSASMTMAICVATLLFGACPAVNAGVIYPINDGFELPNLTSNTSGNYQYNPTLAAQGGSGWTFTGSTGVADNGSDPLGNSFNVVNATNGNHDGTTSNFGQAGFIQNAATIAGPSVISQAITFSGSGNVSVTFSIELRESLGVGNNPIDVKFDSLDLGTYLAASGSSFNTVTTPSVFLTAGTHTLSFTGTNTLGLGNTQFIDNVSIGTAQTPEPSSFVMAITGFVVAGGFTLLRSKMHRPRTHMPTCHA